MQQPSLTRITPILSFIQNGNYIRRIFRTIQCIIMNVIGYVIIVNEDDGSHNACASTNNNLFVITYRLCDRDRTIAKADRE